MELRKPDLGDPWNRARQLAGDPEREAVLAFLAAARARRYLPAAEHERRAAAALAASHCGALHRLVADLPGSIGLPAPPAVFTGDPLRHLWKRAVDAAPWLEEVAPFLVLVAGIGALLLVLCWIVSAPAPA